MVFKKLTDRLTTAASTAAQHATNSLWYGRDQAGKIAQLESMGFSPERARHALNATEGDVDRAAELLLLSDDGEDVLGAAAATAAATQPAGVTNHDVEGRHVAAHNDEQMRLAMEESLRVTQQNEERQLHQAEAASMSNFANGTGTANIPPAKAKATTATQQKPIQQKQPTQKTTNTKKQPPIRSAAAINAGKAAASRHNISNHSKTKKQPPIRSAAAINAGKAAASRHNISNHSKKTSTSALTTAKSTLDHTHPHVKIPDKLQNKSKEEQILRCADRVKPHVMAVDTLLRVLTSVKSSPGVDKFRTIDRTNPNYVTYVRDKPGAEDLLLAMNYRRIASKNELRLERHLVDDALLYLGISALEQARTSTEYREAKKWRAFHAEMRRVAMQLGGGSAENLVNGMTEEETQIRLAFLSHCPKEPPQGRGAWMHVYLGEEEEKIGGGYVSRRFDGDDILDDVLNWLGGCYGTELLEKLKSREWCLCDLNRYPILPLDVELGGCYGTELLEKLKSREWCLCDLNRYPILPLDVEKHRKNTLQYLGLFPSGKLGVRLSDDSWRSGDMDDHGLGDVAGSARGLGAASRSMLH
eukprot:CAMPEP_0171447572 /NCGR_PEP_ID=MMETSP0881-20121228/39170_1 /TAXON_ID=67004 /ORGANISM="Thalassiosira weissflogii, Strain CCMP1336" /LENGTH=585 /DNA_ID=CAMNT_0011971985 /DNA_START=169 /DNA_END=1927 /DNA_ORIENTATION=-